MQPAARALSKTNVCKKEAHASSIDPIRRRARQPPGLAGHQDELIRHYTFNDNDLALIRQRRGDPNRLGFAVQMRSEERRVGKECA